MKKLLIFTLITFSFSSFCAQLVEQVGSPVRIVWDEEHEAEVQHAVGEIGRNPVPFIISNNECGGAVGMVCDYHLHFMVDRLQINWTKHPNPERLGKMVNSEAIGGGDVLKFWGLADRMIAMREGQTGPTAQIHDYITCDDYSWIPGVNRGETPENLNIINWRSERMVINRETGANENQIIAGAYDINLVGDSEGRLNIINMSYMHMNDLTIDYVLLALLGEVVSMAIPTTEGDSCDIIGRPNAQAAYIILGNFISSQAKSFGNYNLGEDFLYEYMEMDKMAHKFANEPLENMR